MNGPTSTGITEQDDLRADLDILGEEDAGPLAPKTDLEEPTEAPKPKLVPKKEEGKDDEADEEPQPQTEEEEEDKEEEEPEVDFKTRPHRPTVREITAKYPNLFKDFPDLREAFFRENAYTGIFPTVDDAREASERAESFDKFSELIQSGKQADFQEFLTGVGKVGGLDSMAANFLPALYKTNQETYFQIVRPVVEGMIRNACKAGTQMNNENLINSAMHLAQWAFGDSKYATGEIATPQLKAEKTEESKDPKYEQEKQDFYRVKYEDTRQSVTSAAETKLRSEIRKGLDPNKVFDDLTTNLLIDRILLEVGNSLDTDKNHMARMNSMWKHARQAGFAGNWKDRILTTYLSGARAIMPTIRAKYRSNATTNKQVAADRKAEIAGRSASRTEVRGSGNSAQQQSSGPVKAGDVDWGRTSDMDILNDRVTLRKR